MGAPRAVSWPRVAGVAGTAAGFVAYALLAHWAASAAVPGLAHALVFIAPLAALAGWAAWRSARRPLWLTLWALGLVALALVHERLGASTGWVLLAQTVAVNAGLGLMFARSLAPGAVPLISRMAALLHGGHLTPRVARYTRQATWAWTLYFFCMALAVLVLFALAPQPVWSAFVNLLSFPLLALMFVGEYIVRVLVVPRGERAGLRDSVVAWRRWQGQGGARPAAGAAPE